MYEPLSNHTIAHGRITPIIKGLFLILSLILFRFMNEDFYLYLFYYCIIMYFELSFQFVALAMDFYNFKNQKDIWINHLQLMKAVELSAYENVNPDEIYKKSLDFAVEDIKKYNIAQNVLVEDRFNNIEYSYLSFFLEQFIGVILAVSIYKYGNNLVYFIKGLF